MKVNDSFTGDFGIMACEISQAVTPDVGVLSTFYEDFMPIYFSKISTLVKYKLGFDINFYNLSNIKFDWEAANENKKESYLIVDSGFVDSKKHYLTSYKPKFLIYLILMTEIIWQTISSIFYHIMEKFVQSSD